MQDNIEVIIGHVKSFLPDNYFISYMTAHVEILKQRLLSDNNRYKDQNLTACMLMNPNFKNVYAKKDVYAYDGTITLGIAVAHSDMNNTMADARAFANNFNGYFIKDADVRYKYKTNYPTETSEITTNGDIFNVVYITLGVHFTNMFMGDEIKYYLNDVLINDYERGSANGNETYVDSPEDSQRFKKYNVGNTMNFTFVVDFNMDWVNNIAGMINQTLKVDYGDLGSVTYNGMITNINIIPDKNREVLVTFNFEVD